MQIRLVLMILAITSIPLLPTSAIAQFEQNTSLDGTRLTYFPRPDANQCFTDCANNAACQGATWIQAGTYNPRDAAMCYLLAKVSGRAQARGHFSMVKGAAGVGGVGRGPSPPSPGGFTPADIGTI